MRIKKSYLKNLFSELPLIALFVGCFFLTQTYFETSNYTLLNKIYEVLVYIIAVLIVIKHHGKVRIKHDERYLYGMLILPYIAMVIYSVALIFLEHSISFSWLINSSKLIIIIPIVAVLIFNEYGESVVDAIFYSAIINYVFYIIAFVRIYGLTGLLRYVVLTEMAGVGNRPLEAHEITFIFGILFLFYVLTYSNSKENKGKMIVSIIFCCLGFKRILLLGIFVSILAIFLFKTRKDNIISLVKWLSVVLFLFCFIWIYISATNIMHDIALKFNVELNGRDRIIQNLDNHYSLSLLYIGKGYGYVRKVMQSIVTLRGTGTNGFHNDILKYYIDLGCIPSVLFFANYIIYNTKRLLRRYSAFAAVSYIVINLCVVICWATDNLVTYPNFLLVYNILIIALVTSKQANIVNGGCDGE